MIDGKEISIREWRDLFLNGEFETKDRLTQIQAGWWDWFCRDYELAKKTEFLGKKALSIFGSNKIDIDKDYIWFKNCCPMEGPLYDDFRIADLKSGDVKYCISHIKKGCFGKDFSGWEVWDFSIPNEGSNKTSEPVVRGTWKEVKKYFNVA